MKQFMLTILCPLFFCSCAGSIPISLLCEEQQIEMYVNGEYAGKGLVQYVVPKGTDYIYVSCRDAGEEVYSRRLYVKGMKNHLFELVIPKDYRYSSGQQVKPRTR